MRTSQTGIDLIKGFEGFGVKPYKCPAGVWTIGYGHTRTAASYFGRRISEAEAEGLLREDLARFEAGVTRVVTAALNQNQFDALVSFVYNLGEGALEESTLLKKLNALDYDGAAEEFPKWNKGGGKVLRGLIRRRKAEQTLFQKPVEAVA